MQHYRNLGGNSGVYAYEIGDNFISVQFNDYSVYMYSYLNPGSSAVEMMKSLALAGKGLNSYISRYVKKRYAAKLR